MVRWLGAFFRALVRRILPISLKVGKSAQTAMRAAEQQGLRSRTLNTAVQMATKGLIQEALSHIDKEQQQRGSGRNRVRKHKTVYKGPKA